ncbi:MAG TPA: glycosyltransferase [Pseudonocardiaceae bacterium]|nr:glycosyltransferase [Pseudonocardiaceae bacterium]
MSGLAHSARTGPTTRRASQPAPRARGKFLYLGDSKLYVRGVTYGTFRADAAGDEYPPTATAARDLALMASNGFNAVRTYTMPPPWFLDLALDSGLLVLAGLGAERVAGYLNNGRREQSRVEARLVEPLRRSARHPAVLGYSVGNEIPAATVRWLGRARVERFVERLYQRVREIDPTALVTYANYPSTEYLQLPFLDFVCFNVFLERPDRLAGYLARLQNLAGDRPLLMTELGLDSFRNGEQKQADAVAWQVRTAFGVGCAGTFVYGWTDEWHRGGEDVQDWAFGLTDRDRAPKPALAAAREAYAEVPLVTNRRWPRVSVVVCAYNAEPTIGECLDAALSLDYPDYEVIVVNDGSADATAAILGGYPVRVISTENRGLSSARNSGLDAADGEIVAYLDSDAYPDPHWLRYLSHTFMTTDVVGVGGPNLPPPGDGVIAECVARAPGGPAHVLLSDTVAEHIPGCNMAFRVAALRQIGGFDPRFRAAGDDVDICWRLQDRGWTLGFGPAAVVWHHRRNSVRAYWRQQRGYGRAEALLADKWPEKYNAAGHFGWAGRIYDRGLTHHLVRVQRVYHGTWGMAPFQPLYEQAPGTLRSLPLTPDWLLLTAALGAMAGLGALWAPLRIGLPLGLLAVLAASLVVLQASVSAARASFPEASGMRAVLGRRLLTVVLHMLQPVARLGGRLTGGLTVWRGHRVRGFRVPVRRSGWAWRQRWAAAEDRLAAIEGHLTSAGDLVRRGGDFERWDLDFRGSPLGSARLLLCVEELAGGAQLIRYHCWPVIRRVALGLLCGFAVLAVVAAVSGAHLAAAIAAGTGGALAALSVAEAGSALGALLAAVPAGLNIGDGAAHDLTPGSG